MAKTALPIVQSQPTKAGSCGSGCGCSKDSEAERRFEALRQEMRHLVARARQEGASFPTERTVAATEAMEARFSLDEPLPLVSELSHRAVDGKHVWVGVREGVFVVLDDSGHEVFQHLKNGETPRRVRAHFASVRGISEPEAWAGISDVLGQIAMAGLLRGIQGYTERKYPTPQRFSRLHLTKACQLECTHCYADSSPFVDRSGEISTERWARLILDFAAHGGTQMLFTGGEALMHKGCIELMRLARENGVYVTLFTNGILVPQYARAIGEAADKVQVSLDGPDAETNDEIRGKGMYPRILHAIDLLLEQGTPTRIGMTAAPARWETWKAGFLGLTQRWAHYPHAEFRLNYGIMSYGRGVLYDAPDDNDPYEIDDFVGRINGTDGLRMSRAKSGCGYCEQLVVGPEGHVYPCHLLDAPICHIDDQPYPEIISTLRALSRQIDVDHVEGCDTCEIRYLCGGTCRVLDSHQTGSRLITTCTPAEKAQKYSNLVRTYAV